jgi:hypothetical protein
MRKYQYLDIISLINSDFYKNNKRLQWHISQLEYDRFSQDLHDWLGHLNLEDNELKVFNIVSPAIYSALSSYLTHVYDYFVLKKECITPVYVKSDNVYKKIWGDRPLDRIFGIELERSRFKKTKFKIMYSFLVRFIPKKNYDYITTLQNEFVEHFLSLRLSKSLRISPQYYFDINTASTNFSKILANKICFLLVNKIEEKYFKLNKEQKQSINFIIKTFISRAHNDLCGYDGFLNKSKNVITGTGNSYYNRLISTIAKQENIKVTRVNHGGERCFYNDDWYWDNEFFQTDCFITYGHKWKDYADSRSAQVSQNVNIEAIGSNYHQKLYDIFFGKKINNKKKVLYIPNSFVGEARQFPFSKIIDPILFDWQKYIIELLQKNDFKVIYKKHPKGFFQEENILGKIAEYESCKPMIEALQDVDTVLCDTAGSAFVESLCAGKNIVLIDTKQRLFNDENKIELERVVEIVPVSWENNILCIDESCLINALNTTSIQDSVKKSFIENYFLKGVKNV